MVEITKLSNKTYAEAVEFYKSTEWRSCRSDFLKSQNNRKCAYCQIDLNDGNQNKLNVDHIKPLRYYWNLRTEHSNLQIVCEECNKKKGSCISPIQGVKNYFDLRYRDAPKKHWKNPDYWRWVNKKRI